ncbi:MAG: non-heme iron oxygenase ferredoxin subunit [Rugosibacter sp.]|nr:MAG: non-heme iron oxygenase ferredoxin subunit [Rugosibacter sp.]
MSEYEYLSTVLVRVCNVGDVEHGEVKRFCIGDFDLAVFNVAGAFYVTDDTCTHGPASLSEGCIDGDVVECPFHYGTFHIPTGHPVTLPCTVPLRTYDVEVVDGELFINVDQESRMMKIELSSKDQ